MRKTERKAPPRPGWQAAADVLGAEGDLLARIPVFVVRGNREIEISGCEGILEYGEERIVLETGGSCCVVTGRGLTLGDFSEGFLSVRGEIGSLRFGGNGEEEA